MTDMIEITPYASGTALSDEERARLGNSLVRNYFRTPPALFAPGVMGLLFAIITIVEIVLEHGRSSAGTGARLALSLFCIAASIVFWYLYRQKKIKSMEQIHDGSFLWRDGTVTGVGQYKRDASGPLVPVYVDGERCFGLKGSLAAGAKVLVIQLARGDRMSSYVLQKR